MTHYEALCEAGMYKFQVEGNELLTIINALYTCSDYLKRQGYTETSKHQRQLADKWKKKFQEEINKNKGGA